MNSLESEQKVINQLERIFISSGWLNGFGLTEFIDTTKPYFFRSSAPFKISEHRVETDNSSYNLYAIYSLLKPDIFSAGNKTFKTNISIAINFYSNNKYMFADDSKYKKYLNDLITKFENEYFTVDFSSEENYQSVDDKDNYSYRKTIIINSNLII